MPQTINDMIATWDNSLTTFSAIKMNVTDTASAAGSLLMDLQVGGTSKVAFGKNGSLSLNGGPLNTGELNTPTSGGLRFGSAIHGVFPNGSNEIHLICAGTTAAFFRNSATFAVFNNSMGLSNASATADVIIGRRAAANLRLGATDAGTVVPQFLSVQGGSGTDIAGANFTITGSQGTGSGAGGSIVFQVAPAGSPGTVQNALDTALTILGSGDTTFAANKVITGTFFLNSSLTGNDYFFGSNFYVRSNVRLASGIPLGWSSSATAPNNPADLTLFRDAANTLALRNGANAQAFRVYNTYTNASNYERAELSWVSNVARWQSTAVGRTVRNMEIVRGSTSHWLFSVNGSYFGAHLLAGTDNLYDIGASGANRPRSIYTSSGVVFANSLAVNSSTFNAVLWNSGQFGWGSSATVTTSTNTDTGLKRSAAAVVAVTDGSTGGGSVELQEMTAPAAPAANNVRIYAEDDGAGKTRLMARFATGAAVQIAIEP